MPHVFLDGALRTSVAVTVLCERQRAGIVSRLATSAEHAVAGARLSRGPSTCFRSDKRSLITAAVTGEFDMSRRVAAWV